MKLHQDNASGPGRIRQINRKAILSHIRYEGKNSRLQLGKELNLSAAAVTSVVNELLDEGLLKDSDAVIPRTKKQGRPISLLELQASAAYALGLRLRPSGDVCYIDMAWSDYTGKVTTLGDSKSYQRNSLKDIIQGVQDALTSLKNAVPDEHKIFGLTIGIPGVVEKDNSIPIAPKLHCIEGNDFIKKIRNNLSYPVSFQNDVNLGATSELYQQPRLRQLSFAYLHIYSGVGSGIVLQGNLLTGSHGWAGEIGQLRISCSNQQNSFEQLLSTDGVLADLLEELKHPRDALDALVPYIKDNDHSKENASGKDNKVALLINEYCENLCDAIRVLHSVLDLDEVMIDFPSDQLLQQLQPKLTTIMASSSNPIVISSPSKGHQAGLYGATLTALDLALNVVELRKTNH